MSSRRNLAKIRRDGIIAGPGTLHQRVNFMRGKVTPLHEAYPIFTFTENSFLNEKQLYLYTFGYIPNAISVWKTNCEKSMVAFENEFGAEILNKIYYKRNFEEDEYPNLGLRIHRKARKKVKYDDIYYFLHDDLLVYFDTGNSTVTLLFKETSDDKIEAIQKILIPQKKEKKPGPQIHIMLTDMGELDMKPFQLKKVKLNINENYNDDFVPIHELILDRLKKDKDKGLVLLHGKPGTGKTSYLRYLISSLKKDVIFLPPNMATVLTDPSFMRFMSDHPNSVFVIEDAETIIMDREQNGFSPVTNLLNISDGLLSDFLNIQLVCSFNTSLAKVDSALMRKGRLIAKYEFRELEAHKAQALSDKLGFSTRISKPMTLAEIYHQGEADFIHERKRAGFFSPVNDFVQERK